MRRRIVNSVKSINPHRLSASQPPRAVSNYTLEGFVNFFQNMSYTGQNDDNYSPDREPYTPTYEDFCPRTAKDKEITKAQARREEEYNVAMLQASINMEYTEMILQQPGAESKAKAESNTKVEPNIKAESLEDLGRSEKKSMVSQKQV